MDNKQLWTTVIVAAVVAVLASLVTAGIMQNVALAPRGNTVNSGGGSSIINAHACSADETCEVNNLISSDTISIVGEPPNIVLLDGGAVFANVGLFTSVRIDDLADSVDVYVCADQSGNLEKSFLKCSARNDNNCENLIEVAGNQIVATINTVTDGYKVIFKEGEQVFDHNQFFVIPAGIYEVVDIYNSSYGFSDDYVTVKNEATGLLYDFQATSEGVIQGANMGGISYTIYYYGDSNVPQQDYYIILDYPQTSVDEKMDMSICF